MTSTNTSFEHVLHNIQTRDLILLDSKAYIDRLFELLRDSNPHHPSLRIALVGLDARLSSLYTKYQETIDRFNIRVVSFVSDYYSIVDEHSDQFDSKYLHVYSSHHNHYNPLISECVSKFDISDLIQIFQDHCYEFKYFKLHVGASFMRRARERAWVVYQLLSNYISSENVYDLSDAVIYEFNNILASVRGIIDRSTVKSDIRVCDITVDTFNQLNQNMQKFRNVKLDFKTSEEITDYCECGDVMQVMSGSSEMVCNTCGFLFELKGTVFDDNQFYCQNSTRFKHAGYEPSRHCKCWLERIQARETNSITEHQLEKIESCIRRDGITNKKRVSVEQLRQYLKDSGLTELNEHVALIKRLITGVAPPQLTYSETQDITNSFSKAVKAYNIIRPSNKSNMLFYPFILRKLIEMHVSDFNKRKGLLAFIHLQGSQTLIQNDKIWMTVCQITPSFSFRPTDRYEYVD